MIPQVNLSISGYESDLLRTSHMRPPSMRVQEISIMPQLDGLASLPMRDPIGRRIQEIPRSAEQESSQGGTYVQRASTSRRREYQGENSKDDGSRRPHRLETPRDRDIQTKVEDPLTKEDIPDKGPPDDEGPPGRGYPCRNGRPSGRGGYPGRGPHNGDGGTP